MEKDTIGLQDGMTRGFGRRFCNHQYHVGEPFVHCRLHDSANLKALHSPDFGMKKNFELLGINDFVGSVIMAVNAFQIACVVRVEAQGAVLR